MRRGQPATDVYEGDREDLRRARHPAGAGAAHGKTVAGLMFGFWQYLCWGDEKTMWVPSLHEASPREGPAPGRR